MICSPSEMQPKDRVPFIANPHLEPTEHVCRTLSVDAGIGLCDKEADSRLEQVGPNELERRRRKPLWLLFLEQFLSPLVWVLLAAGVLASLFQEWLEAGSVLVVILFNAMIGFVMEWQAMRTMDALRQLAASTARVLRNGRVKDIPARDLVPGDVIILEAGDVVPADGRLIEVNDLSVKESALTGESIPVNKSTPALTEEAGVGDQICMAFKGTAILHGNGRAVVTATGSATHLGQIANLTWEATRETTPLGEKLARLSKRLLWLTFLLAAMILLMGWLQGRDLYQMVKTAIALAVAAIPEGLPIVATIALARGMLRLARKRVIVKKLGAVETLGETEVIFTDKTGTLTENTLLADVLCVSGSQIRIERGDTKDTLKEKGVSADSIDKLVLVSVLCNNAVWQKEQEGISGIGDPLEVALLEMAANLGEAPEQIRGRYPRLREVPFDSDIKMMGTFHESKSAPSGVVCVKGALEEVVGRCDKILMEHGTADFVDKRQWVEQGDEMASRGLRVLAFAWREEADTSADLFSNLIFIGLVGFQDPPREDIKAALTACQEAGITVVMVTGDHPKTARNIACETGLVCDENAVVVHGNEFLEREGLSEDLRQRMLQARIFARVSPAQKLDLVSLYQEQGFTVGMTGDGVNDTPALRKADIGIAMGQRGTEAAKEVADIVLRDDAFASIVEAIRQGRGIFENIRFFVIYLLSCNLSELLAVAAAYLLGLTMPLLPLQILFLNLVTDVFPALALGFNEEAEDIMNRPPRSRQEPVVTRPMWTAVVAYAIAIALSTIGALLFSIYALHQPPDVANNFAFYTLILAQLWNVLNLPGKRESFFRNEVTRNPWVWGALLTSAGIMVVAYHTALLREVLSLTDITFSHLGYILLFSIAPVGLIQIFKRIIPVLR